MNFSLSQNLNKSWFSIFKLQFLLTHSTRRFHWSCHESFVKKIFTQAHFRQSLSIFFSSLFLDLSRFGEPNINLFSRNYKTVDYTRIYSSNKWFLQRGDTNSLNSPSLQILTNCEYLILMSSEKKCNVNPHRKRREGNL